MPPTEHQRLTKEVTALLSGLPLDQLVPIMVDALIGKQSSPYAAVDILLTLLAAVANVVGEHEQACIAHNLRSIADAIEQMNNSPQTRH